MAEVRLEAVSKEFAGNVTAVRDLTLDIADGEFLVLLGPSGCGKTTVLRMIAGLETLTRGHVYIGKIDVSSLPPGQRDVAMVFQNYALYPHMTAAENIAFGLHMRKTPKEETERLVKWSAEVLGITNLLDRRPKALSGGERQRVALGRALVRKPAVFLFDEPLSNLDARLRVHMRHEILKIHREFKTTAIYVTHDQFEAMTMGDRIAVLRSGVLQQVGSPAELYGNPVNRFVAEFIGTPSINMIPGTVDAGTRTFFCGGVRIPLASVVPPAAALPRRVDLAIRPESVHILKESEAVSIDGVIERVELLGGEFHLYVKMDDNIVVARVPGIPGRALRHGQPITVHIDPADCLLFNSETGERVDS